jgi:glycosyltransferase involved in cell wall biosynthesis
MQPTPKVSNAMSAPALKLPHEIVVHPPLSLVAPLPVGAPGSNPFAKVAIVIVAYEASSTIEAVLDRIPATIARSVGAILVSDDRSGDRTVAVAEEWGTAHPDVPLTVVGQPQNLGYGGNQKFCYRWAMDHGFEQAVMVHGDGQYAPELVAEMVRPLLAGGNAAVFGSRMLKRGGARLGGMPTYKYVGNKVLTRCQNLVTGLRLSEWHSGYRAYDLATIASMPLDTMSDGFDFDTEIILQLADRKANIHEIPIPTFYGNEVCRVNGVRYAFDVMTDVVGHRLRRATAA